MFVFFRIFILCTLSLLYPCTSLHDAKQHNFVIEEPAKVQAKVFSQTHLSKLLFDKHFEEIDLIKDDIFDLSAEQIEHFTHYFNDPINAGVSEHKRFIHYLEDFLAGFSYLGETLNAREAFETSSGNCLTLAILATALLNHTSLEFDYQRVDSRPIYSKHYNLLLMSSHVQTRVFQPKPKLKKGEISFGRNFVVIDYFPVEGNIRSHSVSKADFVSMYYQNKAADALINKNLDTAYAFVKEALKQSSANPEALNLLGVLYKQKGLTELSAKVYKSMLTHNLPSINTLENYAQLLKNQNKYAQANAIMSHVEQVNDHNPYRWIDLANTFLRNGENRKALKFATRANDMAPYLHEAHFIRSQALAALSQPSASLQAMREAVELSTSQQERVEYLYKLGSLKQSYLLSR